MHLKNHLKLLYLRLFEKISYEFLSSTKFCVMLARSLHISLTFIGYVYSFYNGNTHMANTTTITNQDQKSYIKHIQINHLTKSLTLLTQNIEQFIQLQQFLQSLGIHAKELIKAAPAYIQAQTEPDCCYNIKLSNSHSIDCTLEALLTIDSPMSISESDKDVIEQFGSRLSEKDIAEDKSNSSVKLKRLMI